MKASFEPGALLDFDDASAWYAKDAGTDVSERFRQVVREAIARAERTPFAYARLPDHDGARRVFVRSFPYAVIFVVRGGSLVVVAISHTSREPGYWRDRT